MVAVAVKLRSAMIFCIRTDKPAARLIDTAYCAEVLRFQWRYVSLGQMCDKLVHNLLNDGSKCQLRLRRVN